MDAPAATGGVSIPLTSSLPGVASVPASVQIPSGSTNAPFVVNTTLVAAVTPVTISATRGPTTLNKVITVTPISFSITATPNPIVGGQIANGTVTLAQPAPPGGTTVNLSSSNSTVAAVPASISIAAGETVGTFTALTTPVAANTNVTLTASNASSSANFVLTVNAPAVFSLSINPSSVSAGGSATGTVTLQGLAAAGGVIVSLSSDNAAAQVPATVTVPAGSSTRTFTVTTTSVLVDTTATITATANSGSAQDTLLIRAANLSRIFFTPSVVRGGQNTVMTIELDAAAPPGGATVDVSSSNPALANVPTSVTVFAGQTSRSVTVTTRRVSRTLSTQVSASYNFQSMFTTLTVTR
jgi:hypothetical protein